MWEVCENCGFYDLTKEYCRMNSKKRPREYSCKAYKRMDQAGQYVPNAWDDWKRKAEMKAAAQKAKSGS